MRRKRQSVSGREQESMGASTEIQPVTGPIRNNKQRRSFRKSSIRIQQIDSRLQLCSTPAPDFHRSGNFIRGHDPLVISGSVAEYHPDMMYVT